MTEQREWRLAVDVGGTFIDYILLDERTGVATIEKQPAKSGSLPEEFMAGLDRLAVPLPDIRMLIHGTTVALNTLVQLRGAKTGLITTAGLRDVLELGRGGRPELYNFRFQPPAPLVPRYLRREISERLEADGSVLRPVDLGEVRREMDFLLAHDVEAVAVVLLHSYTNAEHEQLVVDLLRSEYPQVSFTASHELVREWREFERTSTTVINAFTQPLFSRYAGEIEERTSTLGLPNPIAFLRSNGGVMPIDAARVRPVETLGSGPAGGVIGAQTLMAASGYPNAVCADVGGTTYDVALIHDGEIVERSNTNIDGRPIMGSVIDIVSVGAGGGSLASIDPSTGTLRVGPESAGAQPGPACFGIGGTDPTVTDAQVLLNLLDPQRFLGGRMVLERSLAENAVVHTLGTDRSVEEWAAGILTVAQANMANAIRQITTQRGLDPRSFVLLSYGGGGGLFAGGVADELDIRTVIVPRAAAGFSAWGMLTADYREDATVTLVRGVSEQTADEVIGSLRELEEQAVANLLDYGFDPESVTAHFSADVRFAGQEHTITTPVDRQVLTDRAMLLDRLPVDFAHRHRQRYGHGDEGAAIEVVTLRCRAIAPVVRPELKVDGRTGVPEPETSRRIWFDGGWHDGVPVYQRDALTVTDRLAGPAVVDEWTTTVIVPPGWSFRIDETGNLELTREEAR